MKKEIADLFSLESLKERFVDINKQENQIKQIEHVQDSEHSKSHTYSIKQTLSGEIRKANSE